MKIYNFIGLENDRKNAEFLLEHFVIFLQGQLSFSIGSDVGLAGKT